MRSLLLGALLLFGASVRAEPVDVELLLLADVSRSMSLEELEIQRDGYAEALRDPRVAKAVASGATGRIALAYAEWAGAQNMIADWTPIENAADPDAFAARLTVRFDPSFRRTSISSAIEYGVQSIAKNRFQGKRRVLDISGDGPNNLGRNVEQARDDALAAGYVINGLPLMTNRIGSSFSIDDLDEYYRRCVIGGPASFVIPVRRWEDFPEAVRRKLVLELASRPVPVTKAEFHVREDYDCLVGEKIWMRFRRIYRGP